VGDPGGVLASTSTSQHELHCKCRRLRLSDRLHVEFANARSAPSTLTINNVANWPASIYKGRRIKNLATWVR